MTGRSPRLRRWSKPLNPRAFLASSKPVASSSAILDVAEVNVVGGQHEDPILGHLEGARVP